MKKLINKIKYSYIKYLYKRVIRLIWHPYQRATRGFSDQDMWNADTYFAGQFAGMLRWYVEKGSGVSSSYARKDDPYCEDFDYMVKKRDAEYLDYAAIFEEYHKNGFALNDEWKKDFGGLTKKEIDSALKWFSKHFTEFWD